MSFNPVYGNQVSFSQPLRAPSTPQIKAQVTLLQTADLPPPPPFQQWNMGIAPPEDLPLPPPPYVPLWNMGIAPPEDLPPPPPSSQEESDRIYAISLQQEDELELMKMREYNENQIQEDLSIALAQQVVSHEQFLEEQRQKEQVISPFVQEKILALLAEGYKFEPEVGCYHDNGKCFTIEDMENGM